MREAGRDEPSGETDWEGGGSHTWVIPAFARSGIEFLRELYHPPFLLDSQLNPCDNINHIHAELVGNIIQKRVMLWCTNMKQVSYMICIQYDNKLTFSKIQDMLGCFVNCVVCICKCHKQNQRIGEVGMWNLKQQGRGREKRKEWNEETKNAEPREGIHSFDFVLALCLSVSAACLLWLI